jgi:drug/metabolite transporter (DMT)-like permease
LNPSHFSGGVGLIEAWCCILGVATLAIMGECLVAAAMNQLGDLDRVRERSGLLGTIRLVTSSPRFLIGALCMALNFFAMLYTLSIVDLSLAAPATAALTYIGNAIAAKLFLKENVDRRRWLAVCFVACGVVLLSH